MTEAELRVDAGATLLDAKVPGWWRKINDDDLQMQSCTECILGQLFGEYSDGVYDLQLTGNETSRHGFEADLGVGYDDLLLAWRAKIHERWVSDRAVA